MNELTIYMCETCGNLIAMLEDSGVTPMCCGDEMAVPPANKDDGGSTEKHVPVMHREGDTVTVNVGVAPHPMTGAHYVAWVALCTCCGIYFRRLEPGEAPEAKFTLQPKEKVTAVYAWCNVHGLWKLEV